MGARTIIKTGGGSEVDSAGKDRAKRLGGWAMCGGGGVVRGSDKRACGQRRGVRGGRVAGKIYG